MLRRLNNGKWNKPPVLLAARKLLIAGLEKEWQKRPLEQLAFFLNGTSYDVGQLSQDQDDELIIRISNITNPASPYIRTTEKLEEKFRVFVGDLLVSWSASFKTIIWSGPEGMLNQHIFKVSEYKGNHKGFIRHAIEATFDELQMKTVGIGMMHIRRGDFLEHEIPAPNFEVQRMISEYLDWIETDCQGEEPPLPPELDKQRRIVRHVEALASRIEKAQSLREETKKEITILGFKAFDGILSISEYRALEELLSEPLQNGLSIPKSGIGEYGVLFAKVGIVNSGTMNPRETKRVDIDLPSNSTFWMKLDDIFISRGNSLELVGRAAVYRGIPENCAFPDLLIRIRVDKSLLDPQYLVYYLQTVAARKYIESQASGTSPSMKKVSQPKLEKMPIPVPPLDEQRRIVAYLDSVQARLASLRELQSATGEELGALLPSVLDRAFKGEL